MDIAGGSTTKYAQAMTVPPTNADAGRKCPRCGYDMSGSITGRCPECGMTPSPWTDRWKPWCAAAGLDLLMWGMPLVAAAVILASLGDARLEFFTKQAFLYGGLPAAVCLGGLVLLSISEGRHRAAAIGVSALALVCLAVAADGLPNRFWIGVDAAGSPTLMLDAGVKVAGGFALTAGVIACFLAGMCLRSLSRELGIRIDIAVWASIGLLAGALAVTLGGDVLAAWKSPPPPPGSKLAPIITFRRDFWTQLATGLGFATLWVTIVAIRARVRWDVARGPR
ncbi:hypothetical protein PHYC_02956 [Phycisphaerales bacterium]|nr:hypothetical protein PHYC_02956 [Phycisphaerales bacterium]